METKSIHHWDVLALSCIDGRFIKRTIDWVAEKTENIFDFRTEVGSSKAIIESELDRERLFDLISVSLRLHDIKEIWLIDHIDCGAYGGSGKHESEEAEKEFHIKKMEEAAKIINAKFPQLIVKMVYTGWERIEFIKS